jgi:hypothetical protein
VTGVNAQTDVRFDRFVEFRGCGLGCKFQRIGGIIKSCFVEELCALGILFTMFHNFILLLSGSSESSFLPPGINGIAFQR